MIRWDICAENPFSLVLLQEVQLETIISHKKQRFVVLRQMRDLIRGCHHGYEVVVKDLEEEDVNHYKKNNFRDCGAPISSSGDINEGIDREEVPHEGVQEGK